MLITLFRSLILYALVVIVLRLMGKRQIGQLQPYELVVIILISELAAVPMEDPGIPIFSGILPILILLFSSITLSYLSLKSVKAREIICGKPTILIERGIILYPELKKMRYNLSDLLEQLRVKDIPNIADVEFAILETNGQLSVIPKTGKRPLVPDDMKLQMTYEGLPSILIQDGRINYNGMREAKIKPEWLKRELKKRNLDDESQVLLASIDSAGILYVQDKQSHNPIIR